MGFAIEFAQGAEEELSRLRVFDHRRILEAVEQQLSDAPSVETRNRKCLGDRVTADFEYVPPLWELRVGDHRVFYEVNSRENLVIVHAARCKPPGKTTDEVLNEDRET